uniref:Uncharacterized protein n=1 Tax=Anguilla anguilla TaxID=7936 RepID=A0A0E9PFV1_ANGAN
MALSCTALIRRRKCVSLGALTKKIARGRQNNNLETRLILGQYCPPKVD